MKMLDYRPFKKYLESHLVGRKASLLLAVVGIFMCLVNCTGRPENEIETNDSASIFPEYYDLILPPNIAPLNFIIKESGSKFRVEISGQEGKPIVIQQKSDLIQIPIKKWKRILSENTGADLNIDIWTYTNNNWQRYNRITHKIARESIDSHLAYRLVHAVYLKWNKMGIYQRDLTNFDESPIIENTATGDGCVNCHSFSNNDPSKMMLHFRIINPGTVIWNDGELVKVDTKTENTTSAGIYPDWHPGGKHIAFSTGKIIPHLTTRPDKVVDVSDKVSDIVIYDIEKNKVLTSPKIATNRRENMPVWSADGKYLYFTSAPEAAEGDVETRLHSKYDLMRISYDVENNVCGELDTIVSSNDTGKSISKPSISPDGKYIVCAMSDFGYFTIFHKGSDLYSINLENKEVTKLAINSSSNESHSSWSSNGRWLVFSSKRIDDVFTRPHIAYFDENGIAHKPFVLPQEDPSMYDRLLANYNIPELITGKVELKATEIRDVVLKEATRVD